jgi:excisionase family DNA binding protein
MADEPFVAVENVAKRVGVVRSTVYRWIARRHLPAHKDDRPWISNASEANELVCAAGAHAPDEQEWRDS